MELFLEKGILMSKVILLDELKRMKKNGVFVLSLDCSKVNVKENKNNTRECIFGLLRKEFGITERDIKTLMEEKCKEVRIIISKKEKNCSNCSFLKTHGGCITGVNFKNLNNLAVAMG